MKKKVAIVTSGTFPVPASLGGAVENLIQNLADENSKNKEAIFYIFSIYDENAYRESKKINSFNKFRFIKIPIVVKWLNLIFFFFFTKILRKTKTMSYKFIASRIYYIIRVALILHQQNYDVLILENHPTLYLILKLFGNYKKYHRKYIYHMHNKLSGTYGCLKLIEQTPVVMGVSQYILDEFKKQVPNYSSKTRFVVLKNKIDSAAFRKKYTKDQLITEKKKLKIPIGKKIVLFSGRMNKEKGIDKLLKAWQKIDIKDSVLLIVGSYYYNSGIKNSNFDEELDSLVSQMSNVYFTGYIDYLEMPKIYAIADIVVLPSMWEDPAPLTVVETLTAGKPLITTNSGGIPEYADGVSIILNKDSTVFIDDLMCSIKELLNSEIIKKRYQRKAYNKTKNWGLYQYYNDFIDIILSV